MHIPSLPYFPFLPYIFSPVFQRKSSPGPLPANSWVTFTGCLAGALGISLVVFLSTIDDVVFHIGTGSELFLVVVSDDSIVDFIFDAGSMTCVGFGFVSNELLLSLYGCPSDVGIFDFVFVETGNA